MKLPEEIQNKMNTEELHISRIPRRDKRFFIDYAKDYFCGDYGMALKHVLDVFRGMSPVGYEELQEQIDELKSRLEQPKEPEGTKMANGKVIR